MKVSELIEKLKGFEDFDIEFITTENTEKFPTITAYSITEIADIGYSDKVVVLEGVERAV